MGTGSHHRDNTRSLSHLKKTPLNSAQLPTHCLKTQNLASNFQESLLRPHNGRLRHSFAVGGHGQRPCAQLRRQHVRCRLGNLGGGRGGGQIQTHQPASRRSV